MIQGQSYLNLYYNKACTREIETDIDGNYIYENINVTNNAVLPFTLKIWCKNNGSHTAYDSNIEIISSDISVSCNTSYLKIYSSQIVSFDIVFNLIKGDTTSYTINFKVNYDSI